jgi:hypothetical protein
MLTIGVGILTCFVEVESLSFMVHGGNLVIRELTSKQKASAKFVLIHNFKNK